MQHKVLWFYGSVSRTGIEFSTGLIRELGKVGKVGKLGRKILKLVKLANEDFRLGTTSWQSWQAILKLVKTWQDFHKLAKTWLVVLELGTNLVTLTVC